MALSDHLNTLRQKPTHVRERIVLGVSVGVTAFVGIIWISSLASSQPFALNTVAAPTEDPYAQASAASQAALQSNFSQLVGAVGAAVGATTSAPTLTTVDGESTSSFDARKTYTTSSATIIPF